MKLGLNVNTWCIEWLDRASAIGGMRKSQLVERLVYYHAGELTEGEQIVLEQLLEVCANTIAMEERPV